MQESAPPNLEMPTISQVVDSSVASYDIGALMMQTRQLASDYREQTGHALPVTEELARFDAINIFGLSKIEDQPGIDAADKPLTDLAEHSNVNGEDLNVSNDRYLIKGRVIFKAGKARQKLGKLNLAANWTVLLMVIYDPNYLPTQIYSISRTIIEQELEKLSQDKRGSMTVAKYKAIGDRVWDNSSQQ